MSSCRTKAKGAPGSDGWYLTQQAKKEENTKRFLYKRPEGNTSEKARERSWDRHPVERREPNSWQHERSTGIQPRSSYPKKRLYSSKNNGTTRSNYHQPPYRRQDSHSPEKSSTGKRHYQSPYQRRESYSPENKPSSRSYHQTSDRKRKKNAKLRNGTEGSVSDLIWLIRKCNYIWDPEDPSYRDKTKRRKTWAMISDVLGIDEKDCKKHWQYLRRRYVRELNKPANLYISPDFKHLMDAELIFLKPLYRDVSIPEVSTSADVQRSQSILKKSSNPEASCMAYIELQSMTTPDQSSTQSPPSRQSRDPRTERTTSRVSTAGPNIEPSSSSINEPSNGTTLQTADGGEELEHLYSDIDSSGDEEDYSALDTAAELQSANQRENNSSTLLNTTVSASDRNNSNEGKTLADAVAENFEKFSPRVKQMILYELYQINPNFIVTSPK